MEMVEFKKGVVSVMVLFFMLEGKGSGCFCFWIYYCWVIFYGEVNEKDFYYIV